uniref:Uncharacterized protein n=1 Tax=Chromera velia CCMP2878 TaxID=1169474 RepID=A0A0G4HZ40_9ALVE|eukprot:Cvel_33823.t1-p1 / transcript=Cvel_33823.t1 / gene=Cvel_33823 / organism=Chromera_velia_CCMP2878 / gene_product=hypothetical protein / transcript_product=hypothetical protein / location=Cvel_scaffold5611:1166-2029(+) / protein_length=288 / sequence_SO=supercontig / SO=protein_coding / is_pseudo=false
MLFTAFVANKPVPPKASLENQLRSALVWYYRVHNYPPPPFHDPSLRDFFRGWRKQLDHTGVKGKRPLSKSEFLCLLRYWSKRPSLAAARSSFLAVLQFYGARRFSDIRRIRRCDIELAPSFPQDSLSEDGVLTRSPGRCFRLRIVHQKNDPYGRGQYVYLPEVGKDGVPITAIIEHYLSIAPAEGNGESPEGYLLFSSRGFELKTDQLLEGDTWRRALSDVIRTAIPDADFHELSTQSLCKGGFTELMSLEGVPMDVAIDILGHNKSDAFLCYVKRSWTTQVDALQRI